jgi:hypothetical protein
METLSSGLRQILEETITEWNRMTGANHQLFELGKSAKLRATIYPVVLGKIAYKIEDNERGVKGDNIPWENAVKPISRALTHAQNEYFRVKI